ncbi:ATP-binding response regulator [Tautonia marina]|uniref:ATP-binding response regulator n=1 Tax=Tautonia marina TaxID=2653855 RepID=UPI001376264D|nr:response regulator [Tautonia marina]
MTVSLRLAELHVDPEELRVIEHAVEAEGGSITIRHVDCPTSLGRLGPVDADVIVALHRPGPSDARNWLPLRKSGLGPPVILITEEESLEQFEQFRKLGTYTVVPRGHSACLVQAVRLAVGSSILVPSFGLTTGPPAEAEHRRLAGLLRVIGHNMRDLLGVITNAVEVLSFQNVSGSLSQQRTIELLDRQCQRMAGLLDDSSEIARIESGEAPEVVEVFELGDLMMRAIRRAQQEARDEQVDFDRVPRPAPLWVRTDARRLEHLIRHGLHYCRRAARACELIRIDWRLTTDRLELVFEVLPGVSHFEMPRSDKAIDLDLFLASIFADRLGGVLRPGPPFLVELPGTIVQGGVPDEARAAPRPTGPPPPRRSAGHVLLVDENLESIQALGLLIGRLGWHVRATPRIDEAREMIQAFRPHVVLIGLHMPFIEGQSLARSIRHDLVMGAPLLIGISSSSHPPTIDRDGERTFDHIVTKPVRLAELAALLGAAGSQRAASS